jgi:hypothetical protein
MAVWQAAREHPGQIVCTGPKYQYQYSPDNLHLKAAGYLGLGEKYAEVFDRVVNQREDFKPLGPSRITRQSAALIEVEFDVPNPPLSWDEHLAPPHQTAFTEWANGRGFEVLNGDVPVAIESVAIDESSVLITLENPPALETALTVQYAMTQDGAGHQGGSPDGLRGQLCDSDPFVGSDAETISVQVEQGSATIVALEPGAFRRRSGHDVIRGPGAPEGLSVVERNSDDELPISEPWPGESGTVELSFHHDQRNYAVHFSLPAQ